MGSLENEAGELKEANKEMAGIVESIICMGDTANIPKITDGLTSNDRMERKNPIDVA